MDTIIITIISLFYLFVHSFTYFHITVLLDQLHILFSYCRLLPSLQPRASEDLSLDPRRLLKVTAGSHIVCLLDYILSVIFFSCVCGGGCVGGFVLFCLALDKVIYMYI